MATNSAIPIIKTGRGGKFTYHGPNIKIIYPMLDLSRLKCGRDVRQFIHLLEAWLCDFLDHFGIKGKIYQDRVGIWVKAGQQEAKIAAIGIRLKKWLSYHGIALNINPDLKAFNNFIPCGLDPEKYGVTSLAQLGVKLSEQAIQRQLKISFDKIFN